MARRDGRDDRSLSATPLPSDQDSEPSPPTSFSSDKENRSTHAKKRKSGGQAVPPMSSPLSKKRRVSGRMPEQSQVTHERRLQTVDTDFYDPDQDPEERRAVRKGLRDLATNLNDSRAEFIQLESDGLIQTLEKANEFFKKVKQTSDATLDSRLLVTAADLSYKRTAQATLGNNVAGLDIDEFVSKCISFMKSESADENHRPTQQVANESDDEDEPLNWEYLGRHACFPHNIRPAVSGFLLGPLSVQKRVRQQTQRRARERIDPSQLVRPNEVKPSELGKQEAEVTTAICTSIRATFVALQEKAESAARHELSLLGDITKDEAAEVMYKHGIAMDGGLSLFRFCINPKSFGQSVENLFYVSFLVREGSMGVSVDDNGLPTLHPSSPVAPSEAREKGIQKHQAVFRLDFDTWADIIKTFDIRKPSIPHREGEAGHAPAGRWHP